MPDFRRKRNRLETSAYEGRRWYFVTVCTGGRRPIFQCNRLVGCLLAELERSCARQAFSVFAYCFMPDHLHLELVGLEHRSNLTQLLRDFKGLSAARARPLGIQGLWQRGFYDHVLRPGENENAVAWYIFNNPVRRGLAADPRDWPHSGSWMFDWRKAVAPIDEFVPPWKVAG